MCESEDLWILKHIDTWFVNICKIVTKLCGDVFSLNDFGHVSGVLFWCSFALQGSKG